MAKKGLYYCVDFLENYIKVKYDNLCLNCERKNYERAVVLAVAQAVERAVVLAVARAVVQAVVRAVGLAVGQ